MLDEFLPTFLPVERGQALSTGWASVCLAGPMVASETPCTQPFGLIVPALDRSHVSFDPLRAAHGHLHPIGHAHNSRGGTVAA